MCKRSFSLQGLIIPDLLSGYIISCEGRSGIIIPYNAFSISKTPKILPSFCNLFLYDIWVPVLKKLYEAYIS